MSTPVATLLPLSSLPGFQGAIDFLCWLDKTHQQGWQMLPISGPIEQPYRNQGIGVASFFYDHQVPQKYRTWLLTYHDFLAANQDWLLDFALYQALSEHYQTICWWQWPEEIASYNHHAVNLKRQELAKRIEVYLQEQYFLTNQLLQLKKAAAASGQLLLGDLPFYLGRESSLVWSHQELFMLPKTGELILQSGVPSSKDEPFAAQYWGHPLYNWAGSKPDEIVAIFNTRLKFLANFFDLVRLDHANGFFRYGMMSLKNPHWSKKVPGPGENAILAILMQAQKLNLGIYFEDLASESMRLEQFMKKYAVAGIEVLTLSVNLDQQAANSKTGHIKLKFPQKTANKVLCTSTHDTLPLFPWVKSLNPKVKTNLAKVNHLPPNLSDEKLATALREHVLQQKAKLIIVPWQDWHGESWRLNTPGEESLANWNYPVAIEKYL